VASAHVRLPGQRQRGQPFHVEPELRRQQPLNLTLNFVPSGPNFGSDLNANQQNVANTLVNFFNTTVASGGIRCAQSGGLEQASGELATRTQQTASKQ